MNPTGKATYESPLHPFINVSYKDLVRDLLLCVISSLEEMGNALSKYSISKTSKVLHVSLPPVGKFSLVTFYKYASHKSTIEICVR